MDRFDLRPYGFKGEHGIANQTPDCVYGIEPHDWEEVEHVNMSARGDVVFDQSHDCQQCSVCDQFKCKER